MPQNHRTTSLNLGIGRLLVERREQLGLTQEEVASRTEGRMSRSVVANLESGRQRIAVDQLYDLALALGVGPEDLLPQPRDLPAFGGTRTRGIPNDPQGQRFVSELVRPRRPILDMRMRKEGIDED